MSVKNKIFLMLFYLVSLFIPFSAFGTDISEKFETSINEIPQELASPIAKAGLVSIVYQFFRARVEFAPNGYESNNKFMSSFNQSFNIFRTLLYSADLRSVKEKVNPDEISKMIKSYSKNENDFIKFSMSLSEKVDFFRHIPQSAILNSQMYFSLLISGFDKKQWALSRKFTHIWPFCD